MLYVSVLFPLVERMGMGLSDAPALYLMCVCVADVKK